jgi:D-aminoacyl-tRNA deacylase
LKTIVACSLNDPAGTNIRERLLENFEFKETDLQYDGNPVYSIEPDLLLVSSDKGIVFIEDLDTIFAPERVVFISRHYAESGIPSLTAHFTGNFGRSDFGGNNGEIAKFSPSLLKNYMLELRRVTQDISSSYNVTLEATHHGPTSLKSSVLFVELGSTEAQWRDTTAAEKIANSLMLAINSSQTYNKCAVCIGGTHYSEKFNAFLIESEFALGPIVPKHGLEFFTPEILKQILEKSDQKINHALIDKKGLGKYKAETLRILDGFGLEKIWV